MFVAWRDLRHARGRFALMGSVLVLLSLLVGLLSGLTAGLARENTSALTGLPADRLAFAAPPDGEGPSFTDSRVAERTWQRWAAVPGVRGAEPLGIALTRARTSPAGAGGVTRAVAAFGVRPGAGLAPAGRLDARHAVLSTRAAAELGIGAGDRLRLGDRELTISAVAGEAMYSHTPVVWTALDTWQHTAAGDGAGDGPYATVVALRGTVPAELLRRTDARLGTRTETVDDALRAIGSHTAENTSLQLIRGFLFAISALVVGAFFTVWTIQRSADVAVLKALGAATGHVLRDALGQAAVLLLLGTGLGSALAALAGLAVRGTVPFETDPATLAASALVMTALGLLGAALAVRRLTAVDPLTALGGAR